MHFAELKTAQETLTSEWNQTQQTWRKEIETDPVLGGKNLEKTAAACAKVLDEYGGKGVREALDMSGMGNNPELVRWIFNVSKALTEGGPLPAGGPPGKGNSSKTPGEIFYGADPQN